MAANYIGESQFILRYCDRF